MKTDPIQEYVLKNNENFRIGAAIGEAWPDVREKIVSGFLSRLDARLKRKLKAWESSPWGGRFFEDRYAAYYIWKPSWLNQFYLCLACRDYGHQIVFGVERHKSRNTGRSPTGPVLEAVQQTHPSARMNAWWEARITMRTPRGDWSSSEVLWQMHKDPEFLESVAEQILELAEISAPIIDRMVRNGRVKRRRR